MVFTDGGQISELETRQCVFGVPTDLRDDLPKYSFDYSRLRYNSYNITGRALVSYQYGSVVTFNLADSVASFSAVLADGRIEVSIDISGRGNTSPGDPKVTEFFGKFRGYTRIDGTEESFDGGLEGDHPQYGDVTLGSFGGWFFGPQGVEVGLAFAVGQERADGTRALMSGVVIGTGAQEFVPS